jgi:hypothetical protein
VLLLLLGVSAFADVISLAYYSDKTSNSAKVFPTGQKVDTRLQLAKNPPPITAGGLCLLLLPI